MKTATNSLLENEVSDILENVSEFDLSEKRILGVDGSVLRYRAGAKFEVKYDAFERHHILWLLDGSLLLEDFCANGQGAFTYLKHGMYFPSDLELPEQQSSFIVAHACQNLTILSLPLKRFDYLKNTHKHFFFFEESQHFITRTLQCLGHKLGHGVGLAMSGACDLMSEKT